MNRAAMFVGLVLLILGLAVVHFSLANAQPGLSSVLDHDGSPEAHTPTPFPTPQPEGSISPRSGSVGGTITVRGNNFGPGETVRIFFDSQQIGTERADSDGSFSTRIDVPALPADRYRVEIRGLITRSFTFTISSSFSVTPSSGPPGSSVTVRASGFNPSSQVDITMDGDILITASADGQGKILTTVDIPSNTSGGSKSIGITGPSGSDQATFKVTAILSVAQSQASPGDVVSVSGTGFKSGESGISVTFGGTRVASGISADSQGLWFTTFDVPTATAGTHTIKASGSSTSAGDVSQASIILGAGMRVEPTSGVPGTVVRVNGSGARSRERITVIVGNNLTRVDVNASTKGVWSADLTIPTAPGGRLTIVASGSSGKGPSTSFTVTPAISVAQPTGFPGSRLTLRGEGFKANESGIPISFGENNIVGSASADPLGAWSVEINIPLTAAGTYTVSVPGTSSALRLLFNVTAGVSLSSGRGAPGETVTVIGSGFESDEKDITLRLGEKIVANGIIANADGTWDYQIKIPPLSAGTYRLSATGSQTSSANIQEDVLILGSLLTANILSGTPGMTINVSGKGFGSNEPEIDITYDGEVVVKGISADVLGAFARSFVVPPSPSGTHVIDVSQSGGSGGANGSTEIGFQIRPGITLEYTEGPPGKQIQIFGSGFGTNEPNISLLYDGSPEVSGVTADAVGSFQESFDIPPSGAGTHSIQAKSPFSGATGTREQDFTVLPSLALSETTGNVGQEVMVTGQGFAPNSVVTLTYNELDQATVTGNVDKSGNFRLELQIPESRQGDHIIRLDDLQNQRQISFTIEDTPPPPPSLREPNDGGSGGFLGGFKPATNWSAVDDPSGVRYTLQIASDRDFDEIILEKEGLENPRYTLAEEEKLARGDYFWRVKAVDKASNESGWSNSHAMKSGLMPIWLLAMLVGLGLVATGGGAYAFINYRRRRVREEAIPPEFIRILQPEAAPALGAPTAAPSLAAPTRRALPSPFRRARGLSPEEQARLQMVVDFVGSIPLLEISSDLAWLEEMIETMGGVKEEVYQQVLEGEINLAYQPIWLQHPTYEELRLIPQAEAFLQGLEGYIGVVNECASDTVVLLRRISGDLSTAPPLETLSGNQWRFALTVGLGTLAWFRGTYLGQPSGRDYLIQEGDVSETWDSDEPPPMELHGAEASPFPGLILEGLSEEDANFFRDLHIQFRISYRTYEQARILAARLASTDAMRAQITQGISQLGQLSQRQ